LKSHKSGIASLALAALGLLPLLSSPLEATVLLTENFNGFTDPGGNFNGGQWQDNVITLASSVIGSNLVVSTYDVSFTASPAVYQAGSQRADRR
jgi:hypothetical protein